MNKLILAAILATASVNVYATNPPKGISLQKQQSQKQGQAQGQVAKGGAGGSSTATSTNAGNTQSYTHTSNKVVQHRNTPDAVAVISAPTANCRVTHGGGISGPGFGVSMGSSTLDEGCHIIEVSKHLHNLGRARASILAMCQDSVAMQALGAECPELQTTKISLETTTAEVVKP